MVHSTADEHLDNSQFGALLNRLPEALKYMALGGQRATLHTDCILRRGVSGPQGVCVLRCLRTLPVSVNSGTSLSLDQCVRADLPRVLSMLFPVHFTLAILAGV